MDDKHKVQLLQQVGNDVVDSYGDFVTDVMTTPILLKDAIQALEIVLVGLSAREEPDVSTPEEPDLQRFTEQQITDYCKEIEDMPEHTQRQFEGVQIIKQLQSPVCLNPEVAIGIRGE